MLSQFPQLDERLNANSGWSRHRLGHFAVAVMLAAAAVAIRAALFPFLGSDHAFVIPLLGVVIAAWYGGLWPGLLALAISMSAVVYFFVNPRYSLWMEAPSDRLALGLFVVAGVICSLLGEMQRRSQLRIELMTDINQQRRHAERLEELVRERTAVLTLLNDELRAEVAERLKAEERERASAVELQRSNGELEKFAYVASHDLQEPLRKIQAFGDRLAKRYRDEIGEQGREYVDRMLASAGRMRTLIDDLLAFSRVTTKAHPIGPVDLNRTLEEVLSDLEYRLTQSHGKVKVGPLPTISADPVQMRQLFQNLIGNALKFHAEEREPLVSIHAEKWGNLPPTADPAPVAGEGWRFTIDDNGIGFDQAYADRIFEVFQRLHGRDQYEGTGIGLAIARKIVERHGGTITARSQPGQGARFIIDLPATFGTEDVR